MRREQDRRVPEEPDRLAVREGRPDVGRERRAAPERRGKRRVARADVHRLARAQVDALHVAVLRLVVDDVRVGGVHLGVEAVAAAHPEPVGIGDPRRAARRARAAPRAVVLQAAVHEVRLPHVRAHRVELAHRHRVDELPRVALVVAHVEAAVVAEHEVPRVRRVDPQRVVIAVRDSLHDPEGRAAVHRLVQRRAHRVDDLVVGRVDPDLAVIHRAVVVVAHHPPRAPAVVRTPDPAPRRIGRALRRPRDRPRGPGLDRLPVGGDVAPGAGTRPDLDLRVDDARVRSRHGEADAAQQPRGEAVAHDPGPVAPAVGRLPQAAARAAAVEPPRRPPPLVRRSVQRPRVRRIDGDVDDASVGVDRLQQRPALPAVTGLVDATLRVRAEQVPHGGDVHHVRVGRVHHDAPDALRLAQAHVGEGPPAVGGLVHPVSERGALPVIRFARADPQDVRVALVDGEGADRAHRVRVEDRSPRRPVVDRLPRATRGESDVDHRRVALDDRDVVDAPAHAGGPDRPEAEAPEQRVLRLVGRRRHLRDRRDLRL